MENKYCYQCMHKLELGDICPHCGFRNTKDDDNVQHLPCGVVLNNRYLIGRVLGEGGFGITYIGRDLNLDMIIAVKEFFPVGYVSRNCEANTTVTITGENNKGFFEKGKTKFIQEARVLGRFSGNKSIVDVRDFFEGNNTAYIVMEYIDGVTLSRYINEHGPFAFDELFQKMLPVLYALQQIHQNGLIHRDISPDNIMIMKDGSLKLMDFGASREVNYEDKRSLSIVLRPGYAPEEQYRSKGNQGPWTDVYALCATMYKCVTGVTPDESMERIFNDELKPPSVYGAKISAQQEQALMCGMAVYQQHRFRDIGALINAMQQSRASAATYSQRTIAADADIMPPYSQNRQQSPHQQPMQQPKQPAVNPAVNTGYRQQAVMRQPNTATQHPPKKRLSKKLIAILASVLSVLIAAGVVIGVVAANNSKKGESVSVSAASELASFETDPTIATTSRASEISTSKAADPAVTTDGDFLSESVFGDESNIELKVWVPDKQVSLTKQQIAEFQSHYSYTSFKSITVSAVGEADAPAMITADPDSSADIFAFSCDQISALTGKEVLAPVKESISKFVTQENDASSVKVGSVYGQLVAFPEESYNGYGLVYNRSIVSDADASTIEGVLAACKKAGKQFIMDCGNGFYSSMFAFTGGVTIDGFEEDGITQKFSNYDEDEAVATLMAFAKLMKDYKGTLVSKDPAHISTGFLNGKVGAGIDGSWNLAADKSALGSNFGVAKLPTINVNGAKKQIVGFNVQKLFGVNSRCKFPLAAQALAYYLSGKTCQQQRADQLGFIPTNIKAQAAAADIPEIQAFMVQAEFSVPQLNISANYWTPMGSLGSQLYKDSWKADDKAATKQLLQNTIANIQGE